MTIAELIEQLRELPPEMEVFCRDNGTDEAYEFTDIVTTPIHRYKSGWFRTKFDEDDNVETKTVLLIG